MFEIFRDSRTWTRDTLWEIGAEAFMIPETDLRQINGDELVAGMFSIQALSKSIIEVGTFRRLIIGLIKSSLLVFGFRIAMALS